MAPSPLKPNLVGAIGFEPTTPTMSRWCSNQLSYAPEERVRYLKTSKLSSPQLQSLPGLTDFIHQAQITLLDVTDLVT